MGPGNRRGNVHKRLLPIWLRQCQQRHGHHGRVCRTAPGRSLRKGGRNRLFCFHQPWKCVSRGLKEKESLACWDSSQLLWRLLPPAYSVSVERQNGSLYLETLSRRGTWISCSSEWLFSRFFCLSFPRTVLTRLWSTLKGDAVRRPLVMTRNP